MRVRGRPDKFVVLLYFDAAGTMARLSHWLLCAVVIRYERIVVCALPYRWKVSGGTFSN